MLQCTIAGDRTKGANEQSISFVHQHGGYDLWRENYLLSRKWRRWLQFCGSAGARTIDCSIQSFLEISGWTFPPVREILVPSLSQLTRPQSSSRGKKAREGLMGRENTREEGCLPFSQKIRKFRFEVKWKGNFPENLFGNCGQAPEVVHFFRSERNSGNALTICQNRSLSRPFLVFSRQIE